MAAMLRSLRPLKPAINTAFPMIFQSKTETWSRLAMQRIKQIRKTTVIKRCLATNVTQKVEIDDSRMAVHKMDRIFQELDHDVRRTGRIGMNNVSEILNEMQLSGKVTSTQSLLLIRCCGSLLAAEFPAHRIELLNKVLDLLKSKVSLDIGHYNAILKVHLENGFIFSPSEFLANMEHENIEPNRVTYQRLVSYYCHQGDINGASKILEFMKSKNLPINVNVFNALVEGHMKQGDIENAKGLFQVMRSAKLEPTSNTYLSLIRGYAEKGNLIEINNLLTEAEKNDAGLLDKDILEIVYTLAVNGHSQHVDEMITKLAKHFGYNQDIINLTYRLINNQQDDVAYKLLLTMNKMQSHEDLFKSGHFFIRQLVKVERPLEKILNYCDELKKLNLNSVGILRAVESAFFHENPGYALGFINVLRERGFEVRPHYFWPILACYKKNTSKIFEILQTMINMNCPPNFDTLLDYVIPFCNITDVDELIQQLKNLKLNPATALSALITHLARERKLNTAVEIVRTHSFTLTMGHVLTYPLAQAAVELRDLPSAIVILKKLEACRDDNHNNDIAGLFLREYFKETDYNSQKLEELLTTYKENQFSIHLSAARFAKEKLRGRVSTATNDLLDELVSSSFSRQLTENVIHTDEPKSGVNIREMNLKDLEKYCDDQRSYNNNDRGALRSLFFRYCQAGDLEKTMQIKSELDALGFVYTAPMDVALLILYIKHDLLDKALECHDKLKKAYSNFSLDDSKCLKFATFLIKNGRYNYAEEILMSRSESHEVKHTREVMAWNSWRMLNAAADTKNPEVVSRFSDLLFNNGYAEPNSMMLGASVKVQLLKGNIDEALKVFENCCQKYNCTPLKSELLTHFIKQEDAIRLQKVVDLSSGVLGKINTLYDLAYMYIINDRFKQARKVLEIPGVRARNGFLINMCDDLIDDDKISYLEQLVIITKDIFGIDRDEMYFQLLRGYEKLDDTEKALGVWTSMQEENVQPRNRTLVFLSNLLKTHNKPVPFTVDNDNNTEIILKEYHLHRVETLKKLITNGEIDRALSLRNEFEPELRPNEVFHIVEALVKEDHLQDALCLVKDHLQRNNELQIRIFKLLLSKLAAAGKVNEILSLEDKLHHRTRANSHYDHFLEKSYVERNQVEELLKWLETDSNRTSLPNGRILDILFRNPEYINRIDKLATSFVENNNPSLLNVMWNYYFIQENYEKAEEIYKSTPSFRDKFVFIDVIRVVKENNNENMARKLLDVVKSTQLNNQIKGLAYAALIDILNGKSHPTNALEVYIEACEAGIEITFLKSKTLLALKKGLEKQGVAVPASIASQLENLILNTNANESSDYGSDDDKET